MNYLILREPNYSRASDRIRIQPWIVSANFKNYKVKYWSNTKDILSLIYKLRYHNLVFLLSKEFTMKGLILSITNIYREKIRIVHDICDLDITRKRKSIRQHIRSALAKTIIKLSDVVVVPTHNMHQAIFTNYPCNKITIIHDILDIKFLPKSCTLHQESSKKEINVGWFGTSGSKNLLFRKVLIESESFHIFKNFIIYSVNKNSNLRFKILTDNIKQVDNLLKEKIGSGYKNIIDLNQYQLKMLGPFFQKTKNILLTYGTSDFSKTKSTNRVDTSLWLGKRTFTYGEPDEWKISEKYLEGQYQHCDSFDQIIKLLN